MTDTALSLALLQLKKALNSYAPLSDDTWQEFRRLCQWRRLDKQQLLYRAGDPLSSFAFVVSGLLRVFITDEKGTEYNKNFFAEDSFPGSMTALLTGSPSTFSIEALEPCVLLEIDFKGYRDLLLAREDLKLFHIYYLEKHWLLAKDRREVEIVQEDAARRYQRFLKEYPVISQRLPQYHIASHLGVTPTQLSRIRKKH